MSALVECGVCKGEGHEPNDPYRICGHCVGAGQLTASSHTSRTVLQAMAYAADMLGGNGADIVNEARAAVAELIEKAHEFFDAQEALDNRELMGPNADDHDKLMRRRNQARRELETVLARVGGA